MTRRLPEDKLERTVDERLAKAEAFPDEIRHEMATIRAMLDDHTATCPGGGEDVYDRHPWSTLRRQTTALESIGAIVQQALEEDGS